ncbi:hypothetical protein FNF27_05840 [Cafeteria roenbergensis]|uniref:UDP-N-acetylglucosamine--dolichyl-phosphate N-acetylglucosaminephosphotransferase n=2 Tax=Cafeteria roenbergensis TaxID=33653 RepID=A0A5A8E9R4_CAFRO|nr:hypothetical protein FNF27_05840 [Cafeteria roenbergensis]
MPTASTPPAAKPMEPGASGGAPSAASRLRVAGVETASIGSVAAAACLLALWIPNAEVQRSVIWSIGLAAAGFAITVMLVPVFASMTLGRGNLGGRDLGKRHDPARRDTVIPESLGIVSGIAFLGLLIVGELVFTRGRPDAYLELSTALLSITFMMLLGFMDDVLDLKWRYKLVLPLVASMPLLVMYDGATTIVLPRFMRFLVAEAGSQSLTPLGGLLALVPGVSVDRHSEGAVLDLGVWYLVFMSLLAIFCTNAINIYAGINGLEPGQSLVIASAILATNLLELVGGGDLESPHLHSARLMLPFCGVTLALLAFNLSPAAVFVGDTFCYFAGMTIAVAGIQGHFSKTLLLFFAPQIINFLYSVPQLFKVVPCPRHRLPGVDAATGLMVPSTYEIKLSDGSTATRDNMTLICLVLRITGPIKEATLTRVLLGIQVVACCAGIWLRFALSSYTLDVEQAANAAARAADL